MATRLAVDSPSGTLHSRTVAPWAASPSRRTLTRGCAAVSYVPKNRRRIARNPSRAVPQPTIGAYRGPGASHQPHPSQRPDAVCSASRWPPPSRWWGPDRRTRPGARRRAVRRCRRRRAAGDVVLSGGGWGHGLGMSQYGAQGAARLGCSASQILTRYYAGTSVAPAAMPLADPAADARQRLPGRRRGGAGDARVESSRLRAAGHPDTHTERYADTDTDADADADPTPTGPPCPPAQPQGSALAAAPRRRDALDVRPGRPRATPPTDLVGRVGRDTARPRRVRRGRPPDDLARRVDLPRAVGALGLDAVHRRRRPARRRAADRDDGDRLGDGQVPVGHRRGADLVSRPQEALKAQAIAARTFATKRADRILMPTPADQNYTGYAKESEDIPNGQVRTCAGGPPSTRRHGQVIVDTATGALIDTLYTSSMGGHTEDERYVWGVDSTSLRAVDDSRWERRRATRPTTGRGRRASPGRRWQHARIHQHQHHVGAASRRRRAHRWRQGHGHPRRPAVTTYLDGWDVRQALGLLSPGFEITMRTIGGVGARRSSATGTGTARRPRLVPRRPRGAADHLARHHVGQALSVRPGRRRRRGR